MLSSCARPFATLNPLDGPVTIAYRPQYAKALYRCSVDGKFALKRFHLSGILLVKAMPDSSTRVVFQNEMGFPFFDFEWSAQDSFRVVSINEQMDRPALVKVLRKDFELVLAKNLEEAGSRMLTAKERPDSAEIIRRYAQKKGFADYYFSAQGLLQRIENFGRRKVTSIVFTGVETPQSLPASATLRHHRAHFTIQLDQIPTVPSSHDSDAIQQPD